MTESSSTARGERTRLAIIEAAYQLFIEQGFHATSMRQIAQRAGLALGGIYNHFEGKEQIFDAVLLEKHPYRTVLPILQAAPGETIEEFAHNAARAMVAELGQRPDFIKLVFIELSEFQAKHAPHLFATIFPQFLPLVMRFQDQQSTLRDLPPHTLLMTFVGMFLAFYMSEAVTNPQNKPSPVSSVLGQYIDVYLHGILKPTPDTQP